MARCCAWYLERVVTFVNRNAFIVVAVKGSSFCPSAWRAVSLIVSNALRLIAVNVAGDWLIFLGKLVTTLSGTIVAFAVRLLLRSEEPLTRSPLLLFPGAEL